MQKILWSSAKICMVLGKYFYGVLQLESNWFFIAGQTPYPYPTSSLHIQFWHWCTQLSVVWVLTKQSIAEEMWPGRGLNPDLPRETPALYPLLHELMLKRTI
jgi:hypothetical protein